MTFDRRRFQEINQMYAKEGVQVVMPEHWQAIENSAQAQSDQLFSRLSMLDRDSDARELAKETINNYRASIGIPFKDRGVFARPGETEIAEHGGPRYDPSDPASMDRLYGVIAGLPEQLIPLSAEYTWQDVVNQRLRHYYQCNVTISNDYQPNSALARFAVKSGEFVPIYASCIPCRIWFELDNFDRRRSQRRPIIGRAFETPGWDR